jgi:hypothetical protein
MAKFKAKLQRLLHQRIPLKPLTGLMFFGFIYFLWFPTINAAMRWRPHRIANFANHQIQLPFLWFDDGLASLTLRHPGASILSPLDSTITLTRFSPGQAGDISAYRARWFYVHGLAPRRQEQDARAEAADIDMNQFIGRTVQYDLSPQWQCVELLEHRIHDLMRMECLSQDSFYTLNYFGRSSYLPEVKLVADQIEGANQILAKKK